MQSFVNVYIRLFTDNFEATSQNSPLENTKSPKFYKGAQSTNQVEYKWTKTNYRES